MSWNYAELSKMAKAAGGPEALVDTLVKSGEKEMIPVVILTGLGSAAVTYFGPKVVKYVRNWKKENEDVREYAKEELINGIRAYEATHTEE